MTRLSDKVSAVVSELRCPNCSKYVAPRGETCPKCGFPLSRYLIRVKWFRVAFVGILVLVASLVLFVLGVLADLGGGVGVVLALMALVGLGAVGIGLVGLIFGGAHVPGQSRKSSDWNQTES